MYSANQHYFLFFLFLVLVFSGFEEISLVLNAAPTGGHVAATPRTGVAAVDNFLLESLEWTDEVDDLPLTYSFWYTNGQVRSFQN